MARCRLPMLRPVLLIAALGTSAAGAATQEPLRVLPDQVELDGPRDRHGLLVVDPTGAPADGAPSFVTSRPEVVRVEPDGTLVPTGDGVAVVTVSRGTWTRAVPVVVTGLATAEPPSFVDEVEPILTRLGCNQGACHGKLAGQNGFRLSLRGYAPAWDHEWIARESGGRRIDRLDPARSLLLEKPTGRVPHAGGVLLTVDGRAHAVLREWIGSGLPGPVGEAPDVTALEVLPGDLTLPVGGERRLLVRARTAAGRWRDVTWLTKFDSNDAGTIAVDPDGRIRAVRPGETAVRAAYGGLVRAIIVTAPYDRAVDPSRFAARANLLDGPVFDKLAALRIEPSEASDDAEFLRRAMLDTIGVPPTPDEARAFLDDPAPDKRVRLVDALLERPEFVDFWTLQLADLLQNRKERDHDVRGAKGVRAFHAWLRAQVAANRPWDALARDVLTARGDTDRAPALGYYIVTVGESRRGEESDVVASVAQSFLGTRIGCAKCHNHPLERYTQDDYYGFAAFFSRLKFDRKEPKQGATHLLVSAPESNENGRPVGANQPRTGRFLPAKTLDGVVPTLGAGDDPREALAAWITDPSNEAFAGAMVNRLWKHFFAVGLVEPVDDLRASNPPTNPALWNALVREFVGHGYDLKHVMRLILTSRAYGLASATRAGNSTETRFYSHYYARRLPAEVLLDAVSQATGVPETFPGYPVGLRAQQLPDPGASSYFLGLFGRSERVTACACERNGEVTLPQALHVQNGDSIARLGDPKGRLASLLASVPDDDRVTEELFLATLARRPTEPERLAVRKALAGGPRDEVYRDLAWALLNAVEFSFNH